MKQEDKDLLLQDLCGRLSYGVKVSVNQSQLQNYDYKWKNWSFEEEPQEIDGVSIYGVTFGCMDMSDGVIGFEFIKPYLFPLSSMTGEQRTSHNFLKYSAHANPIKLINWYNKNHFDYRGLIEKGLAINATGLNIY